MAELGSHELLELLLHGDCGGGGESSGVLEKPSLTNLWDRAPPSSSALPTHYTAGNPSGKETASEAEMASWLCEIFEQELRGASTATTTKSEGGNAVHSSSAGGYLRTASADVAASGAAECRHGRSSCGRRRSCSGKAAEQRRRDKINDKLRTLQQLIPWCSKAKTDKASTLEEVIKYVKSLQHQVQVMSANGYDIPRPISPLPCMQLHAGDVLGRQAPPVMLPQYPIFPVVYACPHHVRDTGTVSMPMPAPYTRRHPGEPAGSGGGGRRQLAPLPHPVPDDLTVPAAEPQPQLREKSEMTLPAARPMDRGVQFIIYIYVICASDRASNHVLLMCV